MAYGIYCLRGQGIPHPAFRQQAEFLFWLRTCHRVFEGPRGMIRAVGKQATVGSGDFDFRLIRIQAGIHCGFHALTQSHYFRQAALSHR